MGNVTEPKTSVLEELRNELMEEIRQAVPETSQHKDLTRKIRALTAQINRLEEAAGPKPPRKPPRRPRSRPGRQGRPTGCLGQARSHSPVQSSSGAGTPRSSPPRPEHGLPLTSCSLRGTLVPMKIKKGAAMKGDFKYVHHIDVSRCWPDPDEWIPAFLVLKSDFDVAREPKDALKLFKDALEKWLAATDAGKEAWEASSRDFNYGDYQAYDVAKDKKFLAWLVQNGIASAEVVTGVRVGDERYDTITSPAWMSCEK